MREKAIAEYHQLLAADESLTNELFARLKSGMGISRLLYGDRALGISLRPHFLTRKQYNYLIEQSQVLAGALGRVATALLANPALMDRIGLTDRERQWALVDPGYAHPAIICTPDELEYKNGQLRRGEYRIDVIYKRVIIQEFFTRYDDTHPLLRAYLNRDVCLINPFRCKLMHKKASFEILTDEAHEHWFSARERDVIHHCVPWTRALGERKTTYGGKQIDLVEYIRKQRADFILKPNDSYGGHGIFFGNRASEAEWEERLSIALEGDYIVQESLNLQPEEFPIFNEQEWGLQPMFVDTNPFLFRDVVDGAMVRLSDSPIVNVTSGGGETGFFVLENE